MTVMAEQSGASCRALARQLAGLPGRIDDTAATSTGAEIAGPLARQVAGSWRGPWGPVLAGATRATSSPPAVVVAAGAGHLSGGGTAGAVVRGEEYGPAGGTRIVTRRTRRGRRTSYPARTGRQFAGRGTHTIPRTIAAAADLILAGAARIVERAWERSS